MNSLSLLKTTNNLLSTSAEVIQRDGTEVLTLSFDSYDSAEKFLGHEKRFKFMKDVLDSIRFDTYTISYCFHPVEAQLVPFVNIENREATVDDLEWLKDKWSVVSEKNIDTKCSF